MKSVVLRFKSSFKSVLQLLLTIGCLGFVCASAVAQSVDWIEQFQNRKSSRFLFSAQSEFTEGKLSASPYAATKFFLQFQDAHFRLQLVANLNKEQNFLLPAGRFVVNLQDGSIIDDGLSVPSNQYAFNYPAALNFFVLNKSWHFGVSFALLNQEFSSSTATLVERNQGFFSIQWNQNRQSKTSVLLGLRGGVKLGRIQLTAGVLPSEVANFGRMQLPFALPRRITPFFEIEYAVKALSLGAIGGANQVGAFALLTTDNFITPNTDAVQSSIRFSSSLGAFQYQSFQANLGVPMTEEFALTFSYEKFFYPNQAVFSSDFRRWADLASFNWNLTPTNYWQMQSVRAGIIIKFGEKKPAPVFRTISSKLLQPNIYRAKRAFYAHNPIATVTIHNAEKRPLTCQLIATNRDGLAAYESQSFHIEPNETFDAPVFLYLNSESSRALSQSSQITVSLQCEGFNIPLTTFSLTFFNANAWDGDTWSLKLFASPNDEAIQANAKRAYIYGTQFDDARQSNSANKFSRLKHFLSKIGEGFTYISDATTSLYIDQVQYPRETLEKKSGDCEDMVLFVASSLMAIGVNVAMIDLRPKKLDSISVPTAEPESIGHLFALIDTGIQPEHLGELGLTELQVVTRRNAFGKPTLWIPIETTVLNKGFDEALRQGARQYYNEVILKSGIERGDVQLYEF